MEVKIPPGSTMCPIADLKPYKNNPMAHPESQILRIMDSMKRFGFTVPILIGTDNSVIAGHGRLISGTRLGMTEVPVTSGEYMTPDEQRAYRIADNQLANLSLIDMDMLDAEVKALNLAEMDLSLLGFTDEQVAGFLSEEGAAAPSHQKGSLRERFGVPPFSVLNARDGWWQDRKRTWLSLGIESEQGRGANLLNFSDAAKLQKKDKAAEYVGSAIGVNPELIPGYYDKIDRGMSREDIISQYAESGGITTSGTSVFDPVLCELIYRWYCPPAGSILDPFAGGSVRGIVASKLGRSYDGIELRPEQIESNRSQGEAICAAPVPAWHEGDGKDAPTICEGREFDMVFSCPPYVDLEVYSDDPRDISNKPFAEFMPAYREIIAGACSMLKDDRFACFVVGEVRDKKTGAYHNFVGQTVQAFQDAGLEFYAEAILVTSVGTLALRAPIHFEASRKLGKSHQNVLIFLKGDGFAATKAIGKVEFGEIEMAEDLQGEETEFGEKVTLASLGGPVG